MVKKKIVVSSKEYLHLHFIVSIILLYDVGETISDKY